MSRVPRIRFKGFEEDWEQRKLGEIFKYEQPQPYIVKCTEYDDINEIPVLTAGQSFILGYTDEEFGIKEVSDENPLIIFDDFTTSSHYVNFPFKVKSSAIKLLTLNTKKDNISCAFNALQGIIYVPISHERHWISIFSSFDVLLPKSNDEQELIGGFFKSLDHLITLHQRKLEKLKIIKKSMLENLFPQNGEKTPKIRFSGFTKDWEQCKWIDVVDISKNMVDPRNGKYDNLPHISPGNIESFTGQLYDNVKCVKDENLISGKFKFGSGDIIYGKINPQLGKYLYTTFSGLTSADAYVLNAKNNVTQKYLYTIIQTRNFFEYSVSVSMRSGMPKINRDELNAYSFFAPLTEEQLKIGNCILKYDHLITLHQSKLEKLQKIKKSMLESMFV